MNIIWVMTAKAQVMLVDVSSLLFCVFFLYGFLPKKTCLISTVSELDFWVFGTDNFEREQTVMYYLLFSDKNQAKLVFLNLVFFRLELYLNVFRLHRVDTLTVLTADCS